jgi:hypothetical protein
MRHVVIIWLILDAMAVLMLLCDYQWYYSYVRKAALMRRQTARKHRLAAEQEAALYRSTIEPKSHYNSASMIA